MLFFAKERTASDDNELGKFDYKEGAGMNVMPASTDYLSSSIKQMSDMLKNVTDQTMAMDTKLMKVSVTEQATDPKLGSNIDVTA